MARYTINQIEMPGVTTVIGLLDKSDPLMGWATGCMEKWINENWEKYGFRREKNGLVEMVFEYTKYADLLRTARFHYKEVSQEALDVGSQVHNMIEQYIKARIENREFDWKGKYPEEVENGYLAFLEWEKENVIKYIETEQPICHFKYLYAGTLDCITELKNGIYCIDFKASKGFYDGYGKQIASYKYARESFEKSTSLDIATKMKDDKIVEFTHIINPIKIDGIGILRLDKETGQPEWKDYTKHYDRKIESFLSLLDYYYKDKKRRLKNNKRVK